MDRIDAVLRRHRPASSLYLLEYLTFALGLPTELSSAVWTSTSPGWRPVLAFTELTTRLEDYAVTFTGMTNAECTSIWNFGSIFGIRFVQFEFNVRRYCIKLDMHSGGFFYFDSTDYESEPRTITKEKWHEEVRIGLVREGVAFEIHSVFRKVFNCYSLARPPIPALVFSHVGKNCADILSKEHDLRIQIDVHEQKVTYQLGAHILNLGQAAHLLACKAYMEMCELSANQPSLFFRNRLPAVLEALGHREAKRMLKWNLKAYLPPAEQERDASPVRKAVN